MKVKSDANGEYRAGPLYDHLQYSLSAHLDGFTSSRLAIETKSVRVNIYIHLLYTDKSLTLFNGSPLFLGEFLQFVCICNLVEG